MTGVRVTTASLAATLAQPRARPPVQRGQGSMCAMSVAALYVQTDGCYFGLPDVDPWDEERDARAYAGPGPIVAHPPCKRWGRYWSGGPSAKVRRILGDDGGCFAAALASVRQWGPPGCATPMTNAVALLLLASCITTSVECEAFCVAPQCDLTLCNERQGDQVVRAWFETGDGFVFPCEGNYCVDAQRRALNHCGPCGVGR